MKGNVGPQSSKPGNRPFKGSGTRLCFRELTLELMAVEYQENIQFMLLEAYLQ
jgi:hypothetical protein